MRIIRFPDLRALTGLSRASIYVHINSGLLPRPVHLGVRMVGWPESEIVAVNAGRVRGLTDDELRDLVRELEAARASAA